ncbi:condensin complex subunit 2 [Megachile rotundata]|uniref:condensin complex subunit 2 n=1 Tax=Megachile rotundata TaxID=143995 RepID=UPI0006151A08|nr:PREDICTED: condensin complex subunit 2-like [Megachile rotundata]XP_012141798.1 PREDICTED: condensin complex subunit 2-like [Megachile rotundata]XP_012141799.1 PREDICTED: condensin complex subunit 2-like [Megachile rotundata]XP_012141800.1 PREDICTED: condensin complex subunit 2-like [Megachile rotundata]
MAVHKGVLNTLNTATDPPFSSSPLRRKSTFPRKSVCDPTLLENDDEAERLAHRRRLSDASSISTSNHNDKRRSSGFGFIVHMPADQMAERISQCIKLGAENKINPKNAFSLEMIDFMTYMIKKQDANMSNLQVASTSLDVSAKIYGFRVDGVHMDILKMMGGLGQQEKDNNSQDNALNDSQEASTNNQTENLEKRIKKKKKQQIFGTAEALKTSIETEKPSLISMEADLQTTDMLYQVMLPNHATSQFYPHPYNDILVDKVDSKDVQNKDSVCNIPKVTDFSNMEICPPLCYFNFQSWNADDEELDEVQSEKDNEGRFQFDLDASIPSDNENDPHNTSCFHTDEYIEENVDRCVAVSKPVTKIVDFYQVLSKQTKSSETSEYSYIQQNLNIHWAGPSHWKFTNFRKLTSNSNVIETCRQAPVKKRKEIELNYDNQTIEALKNKYILTDVGKIISKAIRTEWNEEVLTLPLDQHYDITKVNKLYLHPLIFKEPENKKQTNTGSLTDNVHSYDDNNDMFHSNMNNDDFHENENFTAEDEGVFETQVPFTGENLVAAPKLTNKLSIAYCVRAKKVDMKQLKKSIWTCLINNRHDSTKETEKRESINKMNEKKCFSQIYKTLPNLLTKTNNESLSFPISFVSLLHLANEKVLKITSSSDLADLIVEQD